ncbi:uncharacterized protein LOC135100538 [Scylla paramamosain]|uniref:uncharacterized protein LOC135100538 n=1 Tax=Scylla paramamosain TaxID=85552 RepID=UPI003083A1AB
MYELLPCELCGYERCDVNMKLLSHKNVMFLSDECLERIQGAWTMRSVRTTATRAAKQKMRRVKDAEAQTNQEDTAKDQPEPTRPNEESVNRQLVKTAKTRWEWGDKQRWYRWVPCHQEKYVAHTSHHDGPTQQDTGRRCGGSHSGSMDPPSYGSSPSSGSPVLWLQSLLRIPCPMAPVPPQDPPSYGSSPSLLRIPHPMAPVPHQDPPKQSTQTSKRPRHHYQTLHWSRV